MRKLIIASIGTMLFASIVPGMSDPVAIPNSSFETPSLAAGAKTNTITGWTIIYNGVDGPDYSTYAVIQNVASPAPGVEGKQYLYLNVFGAPSGMSIVQLRARPEISPVIIAPNTTYTLTVAARHYGIAGASVELTVDGTNVVSRNIINESIGPWRDYSTSFTTAPSGDPRVGLPLIATLFIGCSAQGGGFASFDNVRLDASVVRPQLKIQMQDVTHTKINWPANLGAYTLLCSPTVSGPNWTTVTNAVTTEGTNYSVTVSNSAQSEYYRLSPN